MKAEKNPFVKVTRMITREDLEQAAAETWGVPVEEIYTTRRYKELIEPRYSIFNFLSQHMNQSARYIVEGIPFNRCCVNHADKRIPQWLHSDPVFRKKHDHFIKNLLNEKVSDSNN